MLLNEFLKERKTVESQQEKIAQLKCDATKHEAASIELKSTVAQQQKAIKVLIAQLQEQAMQVQRVSAQLAAASPGALATVIDQGKRNYQDRNDEGPRHNQTHRE